MEYFSFYARHYENTVSCFQVHKDDWEIKKSNVTIDITRKNVIIMVVMINITSNTYSLRRTLKWHSKIFLGKQ